MTDRICLSGLKNIKNKTGRWDYGFEIESNTEPVTGRNR